MILTRNMTPRVLSYTSRDMQLLLKLHDLVSNSIKLDIDYFPNLINPYKCKANWVEVLASLVGWEYDYSLTTDQNRIIIANFRQLLMLRGSLDGIRLAVMLYLNIIGRRDSKFNVTIPTQTDSEYVAGHIYIDDEELDVSLIPILTELLEWVRPVGVEYTIRKASTKTYDIQITGDNNITTYKFNYPTDLLYDGSYSQKTPTINDEQGSLQPVDEDDRYVRIHVHPGLSKVEFTDESGEVVSIPIVNNKFKIVKNNGAISDEYILNVGSVSYTESGTITSTLLNDNDSLNQHIIDLSIPDTDDKVKTYEYVVDLSRGVAVGQYSLYDIVRNYTCVIGRTTYHINLSRWTVSSTSNSYQINEHYQFVINSTTYSIDIDAGLVRWGSSNTATLVTNGYVLSPRELKGDILIIPNIRHDTISSNGSRASAYITITDNQFTIDNINYTLDIRRNVDSTNYDIYNPDNMIGHSEASSFRSTYPNQDNT